MDLTIQGITVVIGMVLICSCELWTKRKNKPKKMEVNTDKGHEITARRLMHNIIYDNGMVNRWEPDNESKYPEKHFRAITLACENFFDAHPELLTDEHLENMACGMLYENMELYGIHPEYKALDDALNSFFDGE